MGDLYHQDERYFLLPVQRFDIDSQALEAHEQETFIEARWWRLGDIAASSEAFVPGALAAHMADLVQGLERNELPQAPIMVGR